LAALRSERILALTAVRVDPNHVTEVIQATRSRAAPTTVANAAHRRVNLVVHELSAVGLVDLEELITFDVMISPHLFRLIRGRSSLAGCRVAPESQSQTDSS
jgi:hypothetical protein